MFLLEVGEPFLEFINFFKSRQVRAHLLYTKMGLLLHKLFTMFLKSGGRDRMTPARLLKVLEEKEEHDVEEIVENFMAMQNKEILRRDLKTGL